MSDFIEKSIGGDVQKEISVIQKERQKEVEEFKKELDKIKRDYPLLNCHYGYLDKKELVYYYEGKKNEV
jgi:hypothetical protein